MIKQIITVILMILFIIYGCFNVDEFWIWAITPFVIFIGGAIIMTERENKHAGDRQGDLSDETTRPTRRSDT